MQAAEIEALGRTIAFVAGGSGDREVLFIHGFGADRSTWMFTLPAIAPPASCHCVRLDHSTTGP